MHFLDKSEYMPHAPDEPGTVRVNHDAAGCSGTSKSLKITRTDDDRVVAKCYRCGGFGSSAGTMAAYSAFARAVHGSRRVVRVGNKVELPHDFDQNVGNMPAVVRQKLYKGGVTQADVVTYGMGWSKYWERFVIPVFRDGEMKGFVARYFGDDKEAPRFITRYKEDSSLWTYLPTRGTPVGDVCAIVEDMWSGIRVSKFCPAFVLLGTELDDKGLDYVTDKHNDFIIFLDDDNNTVKKKAVQIRDRLTFMGKRAIIMHSDGKDPKEYTDTELKQIIEDNLKCITKS